MTTPSNQPAPDFDTLLLGAKGFPAAKFPTVGTAIEGVVVDRDSKHKEKYRPPNSTAPVELEYYKSGDPIRELIITLQTDQRDPTIENDTGKRRVFVPFAMQLELAKAVKAAGGRGLPIGSKLRIVFTHEVPSAGGGNPRKEYSVEFTPVADVTLQQTPVVQTAQVPVQAVQTAAVLPNGQPMNAELAEVLAKHGLSIPGM